MQIQRQKRWLKWLAGVLAGLVAAMIVWRFIGVPQKYPPIVSTNGRIEAVEIDIAAKTAGRVKALLVHEGQLVTAGQVVAVMDSQTLEAEKRQAEAQLQEALHTVDLARSELAQRQSAQAAAEALVVQREAEAEVARKRSTRMSSLASEGHVSRQAADDAHGASVSAAAALTAARAHAVAADAGVTAARTRIKGALSAVEVARAALQRVQTEIDDCTLKAPHNGRVQYINARTGEVVGAGGRVLSMVDLSDVYMNFFLPTNVVGKLALGEQVRLIIDAAPQYVIPAKISFVADVAQFTPKTVETVVEREKLMFRVKASINPELLRKHILQVKTGLPATAYVRISKSTPWPKRLTLRLPP